MAVNVGELLLKKGKITASNLEEAMASRKGPTDRVDRILVNLGLVDERDVLEVLGEQLSIPLVDLSAAEIDVEMLRAMPNKLVHRRGLIPIERTSDTLKVATSDPFDMYAFDELRMMTGLKVEPVLAVREEIDRVIKKYYGVGGDTIGEMIDDEDEVEIISDSVDENGDDIAMAQEASVVKLVSEILEEAINERASDIHIEPYEHDLKIRYRVDGVLHNTNVPPQIRRFQNAIISRIKILANMNIAEKRLPQDGGFKVKAKGREIDFRVSVIPTAFGEGVVLRILDKQMSLVDLDMLGMGQKLLVRFNHLIAQPHGIVLVTGPTGSGKTTTLYAALKKIVSDEIKILTVEDPVEYMLEGVNQVQVRRKIGLDFASALRSFLRHDPDVILVGEIRDIETAEVAINASLTGHLVFSTLHTNDSVTAPTRLLDMGIEPFLISSSVEGVLAQRLVRRICRECKEEYEPDPAALPPDFPYEPGMKLHRGAGCRKCANTPGYSGRVGIYELLLMNEELRELIVQRASSGKLLEVARRHGLTVLREDGFDKAVAGETTVEEVVRVTREQS
ncbi:MAG: type II secretion system ATPase GspE [Phycisphaerae bacterium]|nr:type II secretion system ATPase GspE [Phycisphaerae bacterium]